MDMSTGVASYGSTENFLMDAAMTGSGGNFLAEDYTFSNFKSEMFKPKLIDRSVYANWKADGSKTLELRVNEKVKEILENFRPKPVPSQKFAKIVDIKDYE